MSLKNHIREFRFHNSEMTQQELANHLNISRQTVIAVEKGKFNPSVIMALKMARTFNCSVEDLFYLEDDVE